MRVYCVSKPYKIDWIYLYWILGKKWRRKKSMSQSWTSTTHNHSIEWFVVAYVVNRHKKKKKNTQSIEKNLLSSFLYYYFCSEAQKTTVNDIIYFALFTATCSFLFSIDSISTEIIFDSFFLALRCYSHFDILHAFYSFSILHVIIINMWNWVMSEKMKNFKKTTSGIN